MSSNQSIYINPKFRNAHINPNFLPRNMLQLQTEASAQYQKQFVHASQPVQSEAQPTSTPITPSNIFINPNFLHRLQPTIDPPHKIHPIIPSVQAPPTKFVQARIISQTSRKLVRQAIVPTDLPPVSKPIVSSPLLRIGTRKLIRRSTVLPSVVAKPRFASAARVPLHTPSRYRVRNVAQRPSSAVATKSPPIVLTRHKLMRISGNSLVRSPQIANPSRFVASPASIAGAHRKLSYLSINGVFYRSTKNKLQRQDRTVQTAAAVLAKPSASADPRSPNGIRSISVRGTKYSVSSDGRQLQRCLQSPSNSTDQTNARLDIGGLTYVRIAPGTFERTDGHRTRVHLNAARQKSIQFLLAAGSRAKSNVPCPIYQRLGKCVALERGRCRRVHDAKRVAICTKFLQGSCQANPCLLSHAVTLSKMPTCKFFLAGICVRDDCPYLHKKLSARADVCADFVRGFCERAELCDKRHEFVCPELAAHGKCSVTRCPFPHTTANASKRKRPEEKAAMTVAVAKQDAAADAAPEPLQPKPSAVTVDDAAVQRIRKARYTTTAPESTGQRTETPAGDEPAAGHDDDVLVLIPARPKLGALPAYIPL